MVDYFDPNAAANDGAVTNGVAQPTVNGGDDLGMDEISVGLPLDVTPFSNER